MTIKRLLAFCLALTCALAFAACTEEPVQNDSAESDNNSEVIENVIPITLDDAAKMTDMEILDALKGINHEDIAEAWGERDGMLSGFWGDYWYLDDNLLILYYDDDGNVEAVKISSMLAK